MAIEITDLDQMQAAYKAAVDEWIDGDPARKALASVNHSEAEVDPWEAAGSAKRTPAPRQRQAKKAYEDALREKFFNF